MIRLYQGNCLQLLERLAPESVDMCLLDPPYSSGGLFCGDRKKDTRTKYCDDKYKGIARMACFSGDNMDQRSFVAFMAAACAQMRRATKAGGVLAAFIDWRNLPAMSDALQMGGWVWRGIVV